jgi:hypothetical protein
VSGFWSPPRMRRIVTGTIVASVVAGSACLWAQTMPGGAAMPAGGAMPPPDQAIAEIDGRPINNSAFNSILMQVAGMRVFQQVFDLTLVQKACGMAQIPLNGKEFEDRLKDEYNRTLKGLDIKFNSTTPMTPDEENKAREQAMGMVLQRQGVTAVEFRIGLETRANLRAIAAMEAKDKTTVTQDEVEKAYTSEYSQKRSVHIFVLNDKEATNVAVHAALADYFKKPEAERKGTLDDLANEKKFPVAAWTISQNAENIDQIKKVAFAMAKVGEVSADTIFQAKDQKDEQHVIIVLDKIIPEEFASHPKTAAEMESIKQKVHDFKEGQWMNNKLALLRANAAVKINDPILLDQYNVIAENNKRQAAIAAAQTQPSAMPPAATLPTSTTPPAPAATRGR